MTHIKHIIKVFVAFTVVIGKMEIGNCLKVKMTMDQYGPNKLPACRQLFPKGDEDLNSIMIREEMRKDQEKFKEKYNYDPVKDKPLPGRFVYTFDEAKGLLIGRQNRISIENEQNNELIEINETDGNHKDSHKTPIKDGNQIRNENGTTVDSEACGHKYLDN